MPEQLDKPKLTRAILKSHGIYYHEKVYLGNSNTPILPMPEHVNKLRDALLEFSGVQILDSWKMYFEDEETNLQATHRRRDIDARDLDLHPPTSAYLAETELRVARSDWKKERKRLEDKIYASKDIANEARRLDIDAESGWMDFLRAKFFKRLERHQDENDDDWYYPKPICFPVANYVKQATV